MVWERESKCLQSFWPEQLRKMDLSSTAVGKLLMEQACGEEGRSGVWFGVYYFDIQMGKSVSSCICESGVQERGLGRKHNLGVVRFTSILLTCTFTDLQNCICL